MKVERGKGRKESKTNRRHSTPTGHESNSDGRRTGGSVALQRFPSRAGLRTTPWGEEAADGLKGTRPPRRSFLTAVLAVLSPFPRNEAHRALANGTRVCVHEWLVGS